MEHNFITRGEIYRADLGTGIGSEQAGIRPVLILQNNIGNQYSPTVIVAPLTSKVKRTMATHVKVILPPHPTRKTKQVSWVLLEQIKTIDKERLDGRICSVTDGKLKEVDAALKISVGLNPDFL